jgi:hypothetical protein
VRSGNWALGVACESLLRSLEMPNAHFSLGYDDRLKSIGDKLHEMFGESFASMP